MGIKQSKEYLMKLKLRLMLMSSQKGLNKLNNFLVVDLSEFTLTFVKIDCIVMENQIFTDLHRKVQWH